VLQDFLPAKRATSLVGLPGGTRLIDDLGCDSLSIVEMIFMLEDLFGIRIANDEIVEVRTLDELRAFVGRKLSERPAK
jgi:3-hydroxyacyl-[acyl-carrier-protein] dehydratase